MARTSRTVLFEVQSLDGRRLRIDFDRYCYAVAEFRVSEKTNVGAWHNVPGPYFGSIAGAIRRLHREQLSALDGLTATNVGIIMNQWGEKLSQSVADLDPKLWYSNED